MAHIALLMSETTTSKKDKLLLTQLEDWIVAQGHQLAEVSTYSDGQDLNKADIVILAIPVEQQSYQAVKQFMSDLPANSLSAKKVCPFILGGTPAHLSIMELYLEPLLTRLGVSEQIKPVTLQTCKHKKKPKHTFTIDRFYQFLQTNIPQSVS
ncbi:NADPH-dependent FMN reductase family protein [Alkalicoccobacillus murimartini]|uniref:NAD(P)H-dependent FMN reductase n=1 Tax=Alkalicoccobacillus murimartini TaxID=171685 RepID=A0ABT9YG48_9BACI|nr:hypothetical protein [Alkalicoccobacillus murimartini]MDQ0206039.1 NAD(P)H-dependent FMN reductase [Alkalicoccobacillus murimartini]